MAELELTDGGDMAAEETKAAGIGTLGGSYPSGACREIYFEEKSHDQKIAKLAEAVEYLTAKLKESSDAVAILMAHSHREDGHIVILVERKVAFDHFSESYFFKNPLGRERARG